MVEAIDKSSSPAGEAVDRSSTASSPADSGDDGDIDAAKTLGGSGVGLLFGVTGF